MEYKLVQRVALSILLAILPVECQTSGAGRDYLLGPGDQVTVFVADLPDEFADKTFRVDPAGDLSFPVIGRLRASGLTTAALESQARSRLSTVLKNPEVVMSLVAYGSKFVSVLGAVNMPGVHVIDGPKTLFEMLSLAGGLRQDAGYLVTVTRKVGIGRIPLPEATVDPAGQLSVVSIRLRHILNATNSTENIVILPGDTISVPKAELVYAVGSVVKPGGFPLNEQESLSALQVVSLAEGLQKTAATNKAKILRLVPGSTERAEVAVDLKQLMAGKGADVSLRPGDILFVPNSSAKSAGFRTIDAIVNAATGAAIYGHY